MFCSDQFTLFFSLLNIGFKMFRRKKKLAFLNSAVEDTRDGGKKRAGTALKEQRYYKSTLIVSSYNI